MKRGIGLLLLLGVTFSFAACAQAAPPKSLTYKNAAYGYQMTFPEAWRGFYETEETERQSACLLLWQE